MQCRCGFENAADARFCGKCRLALAGGETVPGTPMPATVVAVPTGGGKPSARPRSRALMAILAVVVVVAAAGYWWMATLTPGPGEKRRFSPSNAEFAYIPAGSFEMGSVPVGKEWKGDETPRHRVTLTRGFWMGVTEVTNREYHECVAAGICTPPHYDDGTCYIAMKSPQYFVTGTVGEEFRGDQQPVVAVDWKQAETYCKWTDGRLPTEAEWEYACRAGSATTYYWGDSLDEDYAWYEGNSGGRPHAVGQKRANAFGLFDMAGNVWEWCSDWYSDKYYSTSQATDPAGPLDGTGRVLRGGGYDYGNGRGDLYYLPRSANRTSLQPVGTTLSNYGFRCVRSK